MQPKMKVHFECGYANKITCCIYFDDIKHILELEDVEKLITDTLDAKGFTTSLTTRQKYQRIKINN